MTYINLTAQQAEFFNRTGKLLIVEKMETQPQAINIINDTPQIQNEDLSWKEIEATYRVGEVYGFKEPWRLGRDGAAVYEDGLVRYQLPEDMLDAHWDVRLFGKCVKSEARKLASITAEEGHLTGLPAQAIFEPLENIDWCFFSLFEKCEKGGV